MTDSQSALFEVDVFAEAESRRKPHTRCEIRFRSCGPGDLLPRVAGSSIPEDHAVRLIKAGLDAMALGFLRQRYAHLGGYGYDPLMMLSVALYGCMQGLRVGRELQEACLYDDRYRFLAGGLTPDDRTFDRFLERHGLDLDELLNVVLRFARKFGMGRGCEVVADGCKVPCSASWWKYMEDAEATPSDPDARLMNSHGRKMVGYNALVATDTADGLIVGVEVVNDQNDFHVLPALVEAMYSQLGEDPAAIVADKGFDCQEAIQYLEERGIDSVIASKSTCYDCFSEDEDGNWCCPAGKALIVLGSSYKGRNQRYERYGPEGGCRGCPLRSQCPFFRKRLHLPEGSDLGTKLRNYRRVHSATYSGAMLRRRRGETPFAFLRRHDRFERFRGRSLRKARAELRLWAVSYNLRKILRAFKSLQKGLLRAFRRQIQPMASMLAAIMQSFAFDMCRLAAPQLKTEISLTH
jgi:transposase